MKRKTTNAILFSLLAVILILGCKNAFHEPEYNPSVPIVSDGKSYTVTFNRNGGSGTVPDPIKWESGGSINLPYQGGLSRANYTFGGWNTNTSGTGTTFAASAPFTVPNQDVTLYAKWDAVANNSGGGGATTTPGDGGSAPSKPSNTPLSTPTGVKVELDAPYYSFSGTLEGYLVKLSWDNVSGATYFTIYFSELPNSNFFQAGVSVETNTLALVGLGQTCYFKISANNDFGLESPLSVAVSVTIPPK